MNHVRRMCVSECSEKERREAWDARRLQIQMQMQMQMIISLPWE